MGFQQMASNILGLQGCGVVGLQRRSSSMGFQANIGGAVMVYPFRGNKISDMPGPFGKVPRFEIFIGFVSDNVANTHRMMTKTRPTRTFW